jgi:hypothetical protein
MVKWFPSYQQPLRSYFIWIKFTLTLTGNYHLTGTSVAGQHEICGYAADEAV